VATSAQLAREIEQGNTSGDSDDVTRNPNAKWGDDVNDSAHSTTHCWERRQQENDPA
jgi:hypothetical protein